VSAHRTAGVVKPFWTAARNSTPSRRALVVAAACLLLAGIFVLEFVVSDPNEGIAVLYTIPIALLAIQLGLAGGIAAALVATALFAIWSGADAEHIGVLGFFTRVTGFLVLGGLLGYFANRLRTAYGTVRRREQQLQAILDNSTAMIALKDTEGRYLLVNRQFEQLFKKSQAEVEGKTDRDLFPRYMADALLANDRRVLKECCALEFEETAPGENGPHTYLSVKFPLLDEDGHPYCVCVIATDITLRKEAEKQLVESKDRFREILDTTQEAFVAMNSAGEITAWNRAAEQTFGWPSEKVIGRPLADVLVPERYREAHWLGLDRFRKTGKGPIMNKRIELMALHRDGRELPVEMTVTPVRVRGGFSFNAFMHDISERKRVEQEAVKLSAVTATGNGGGPD
jgi:PAS domain S-box-containing protein